MKPYIIPNDDRDYTDTIKFQKKKQKWKESGMSEKDIEKLTNLYHNFDVWGNDKGCNYSNTVIAYDVSEKKKLSNMSKNMLPAQFCLSQTEDRHGDHPVTVVIFPDGFLHRLLYVMDANPYQRYSQVAAQHRMSAGIWRFLTAGLILILIQ